MWAWGFNIMKTSTMSQNIDLQVFFNVKASLYTWYMFSTVPTWVRLKSPGLGNAEGSGEEGRNARAHDGRRNSAGDSRTRPCLPDTAGCNRPFHTILRSIMMFYKVFMKTHSSEKYFNTLSLKNSKNDKDEKFCVRILMFSLFHSLYEQTGDSITYHTHSQLDHFNQNMDVDVRV